MQDTNAEEREGQGKRRMRMRGALQSAARSKANKGEAVRGHSRCGAGGDERVEVARPKDVAGRIFAVLDEDSNAAVGREVAAVV